MTLLGDVMFGPVAYLIEYLPVILLILVLLALIMTALLIGVLVYLKKRRT